MTAESSDRATGTGTVTPDRFAKVRAIFEAALERPVRERRAFVEGAGDPAPGRKVEAMLAADAAGDPMRPRRGAIGLE